MFAGRGARAPLTSIKLLPKLMLAFVAMAMLTGFCGLVGLIFVDRIGTTVSIFAERTSPLLVESTALMDHAQRTRATFLDAVQNNRPPDEIEPTLDWLGFAGQSHIQQLRRLTMRSGITVPIDEAERLERTFTSTVRAALAAQRRDSAATELVRSRVAEFESARRRLETITALLALGTEAQAARLAEDTRLQIEARQHGIGSYGVIAAEATTTAFDTLQDIYKLVREADRVRESVYTTLAETNPERLVMPEIRAVTAFNSVKVIAARIAARPGPGEGRAELSEVLSGFSEFETRLIGPTGYFTAQREALAARAEFIAGREELERIEKSYLALLEDVQRAVRAMNNTAEADARASVQNATAAIAGAVLLALLMAIQLGGFMAHRITAPIQRLTRDVADIGASRTLEVEPDPALVARGDEIGTLSRSFYDMLAELADARSRLIAASEEEIRTQNERLNAAIDNMRQGLSMYDRDQRLIICNARFAEIYALPPELTRPGTSLREVLTAYANGPRGPAQRRADFVDNRVKSAAEGTARIWTVEQRSGHVISVSHQPMPGGGWVALHEDITERRKAEAQIAHLAHHDALTNLSNRVSFRASMDEALAHIDGDRLAVFCIDLDRFKAVNDTLGHPVGDALLQMVAERLRACVGPEDVLARLGGDEFAIVQLGCEQPTAAATLARQIIEAVSRPYQVCGHEVMIGASIGIAVAPLDGRSGDQLLHAADLALYRVKSEGRNAYRFFEADMNAKMQARRALELDLRKALAQNELELF